MMDWTDRHCRFFHRMIAPRALLYTEMVTAAALVHGDHNRLLAFDSSEHPVALQIGGCDPGLLAQAARLGEQAGYDEINFNVGCPSDRVQAGRFGACLMAEPGVVADCVAAMAAAVELPITVKTRLGIDRQDSYDFLKRFVAAVAQAGCDTFIIHARKAWLSGLSPKDNRHLPPLDYNRVARLKGDFPHLSVILNGGVGDLATVRWGLERLDGVMLGRRAYRDPYVLVELHGALYGWPDGAPTREAIVAAWLPYLSAQLECDQSPRRVARALLGLFKGQPAARAWRRMLSTLPTDSDPIAQIKGWLAAYPVREPGIPVPRSPSCQTRNTPAPING